MSSNGIYNMATNNKTLQQKLIFDMIAFTLFVAEDKREAIRNKINDPEFYEPYKRKVYPNSITNRYNNKYEFSIYNDTIIKLEIYPINKSHNFLRVEYNPTKLTKIGRVKLRLFLIKLLGITIMKTIYFHAVVTRLDLTLDVYDMEANLYIQKNRAIQSSHFRASDGKLSSQIIGSDRSNCRITMYDKNLEQQNNTDHTNTNYQRIEVRRRKLNCSMNNLNEGLLKELKQLNFYSATLFDEVGFSKKFLNNVVNDGLNSALAKLDDNKRRRYKRYLDDYRVYPIALDNLNFEQARLDALGSLIQLQYQEKYQKYHDEYLDAAA